MRNTRLRRIIDKFWRCEEMVRGNLISIIAIGSFSIVPSTKTSELVLGHSRVELAYSFDMDIVSQKDNINIRHMPVSG